MSEQRHRRMGPHDMECHGKNVYGRFNALFDDWMADKARVAELEASLDALASTARGYENDREYNTKLARIAQARVAELEAKVERQRKNLDAARRERERRRPINQGPVSYDIKPQALTDEALGETMREAWYGGVLLRLDWSALPYADRGRYIKAAKAVRAAVEAQWAKEKARLERIEGGANALVGQHMRDEIAWRAERDSLRAQLAEAEKRVDETAKIGHQFASKYELERDRANALLLDLEQARKTRTVRPNVRFECTANEICDHIQYTSDFALRAIVKAMDYLSTRAVVEVPEGVPSAEDLVDLVKLGEQQIVFKANKDGTWPFKKLAHEAYKKAAQLILDRLSPYLQPQASVDPKLCETPMATAETLEQLAETARGIGEAFAGDPDVWIEIVTAILRAARPYVDVSIAEISEFVGGDAAIDIINVLNSRIRYRVELPPYECPKCARVREIMGEK